MASGIVFIGSKALGQSALGAVHSVAGDRLTAAITHDDRDDTRSALRDFEMFCGETGVPLRVLAGHAELLAVVDELQPELCIVVGWYWILRKPLLDRVPRGIVGVHGSLLPKHRGGAPLVWAIFNGETESGVSLFHFDEGMDTGDVVGQGRFAIGPDETIADILAKVEGLAIGLLRDNVLPLLSGTAPRSPQDHSQATYCSLRRPEDGLIRWTDTGQSIYNAIRAQTRPYPGAFTHLEDGRCVRLWGAERFPSEYLGVPGLVAQTDGPNAIVTCGQGAVVLKRIQVDGGRETNAAEILKSGMRLGRPASEACR